METEILYCSDCGRKLIKNDEELNEDSPYLVLDRIEEDKAIMRVVCLKCEQIWMETKWESVKNGC